MKKIILILVICLMAASANARPVKSAVQKKPTIATVVNQQIDKLAAFYYKVMYRMNLMADPTNGDDPKPTSPGSSQPAVPPPSPSPSSPSGTPAPVPDQSGQRPAPASYPPPPVW